MKAKLKQRTPKVTLEMSMEDADVLIEVLGCIVGGYGGMPLKFQSQPDAVSISDTKALLESVVNELEGIKEEYDNGN